MKSLFVRLPHAILLLTATALFSGPFADNLSAQNFFIGGYGDGIYASTLSADGKMSEPKLTAKQYLPSFFALHPKKDILYVVTESGRNDASNPPSITSYQFDRKGWGAEKPPVLTKLNSQKIDGDAPCHVSVDAAGEFLAIANYTSGSVVLCRIGQDGSIEKPTQMIEHKGAGPNKQRQERAHAHCCIWESSDRYLFVADLGMDKVFVYELNRNAGELKEVSSLAMASGSGPRHVSVHPNGKWVYIVNELNMTLTAASWNAKTAQLSLVDTVSTLPKDAKGNDFSTAEVLVHPSGRFVYSSNRGHHTIASFRVDVETGKLTPIGHTPTNGKTPRNFRITPKGDVLLAENQQSDSIFSFKIDPDTGELKGTGFSAKAPQPACIKFVE